MAQQLFGKILIMSLIDTVSTQGMAYYNQAKSVVADPVPEALVAIEARRADAVRAANEQAGDDCRALINNLATQAIPDDTTAPRPTWLPPTPPASPMMPPVVAEPPPAPVASDPPPAPVTEPAPVPAEPAPVVAEPPAP